MKNDLDVPCSEVIFFQTSIHFVPRITELLLLITQGSVQPTERHNLYLDF